MTVLHHSALPVAAPSPLVGEGISAGRSNIQSGEGSYHRELELETTPHPPPLRAGTLSRKGRG